MPQPGGTLMSSRLIRPSATASRCSQIAQICQPSMKGHPGSTIAQACSTKSCSLSARSFGVLCVIKWVKSCSTSSGGNWVSQSSSSDSLTDSSESASSFLGGRVDKDIRVAGDVNVLRLLFVATLDVLGVHVRQAPGRGRRLTVLRVGVGSNGDLPHHDGFWKRVGDRPFFSHRASDQTSVPHAAGLARCGEIVERIGRTVHVGHFAKGK